MAPWDVLGIEESADARTIKRAYAKKLKVTRPDDDPEGFQQLHDAYKWALDIQRHRQHQELEQQQLAQERQQAEAQEAAQLTEELHQKSDPDDILETIIQTDSALELDNGHVVNPVDLQQTDAETEENREDESNQKSLTDETASEDIDPEREERIEEYHRLLAQVEALLGNNRLYPQESNWKFLEKTPHLLDEEFNWNLGLQVFLRILKHNSDAVSSEKRKNKNYSAEVTDNIIHYCDLLFGWRSNAQYLYAQAEEEGELDAALILDKLADGSAIQYPSQPLRGGAQLVLDNGAQYQTNEKDEGEFFYFGGLFQRALAVLVDLLILFTASWMLLSVVQFFSGAPQQEELDSLAISLAFVGYFLMALIMESSSWQATPGKRLMGFKVTRKDLGRVGYGLGLWRLTAFILTLPFFKFTWIINAFLGGNLLHDRLSRTHVINIRKR